MTNAYTPLQIELLERWEASARGAGAPLPDELQPGLSDAEIDGLLEPLGLRPPDDLRTLWGWRTAPVAPSTGSGWQMHPVHAYLPPARAVADTIEERNAADWGIDLPDNWLVVWDDQVRALCLDCSEPERTAVYSVSAENTLFADSVAEMLERWIALFDNGFTVMLDSRWAQTDDAPYSGTYGRSGDKLSPPQR